MATVVWGAPVTVLATSASPIMAAQGAAISIRNAADAADPADTTRAPRRSPRVWVNLRSRLYHCPGSKWYGKGKRGAWMTETQAKIKGYRPAYKRECGT